MSGITAEPVTLKVNCLKVHKNKAVLMTYGDSNVESLARHELSAFDTILWNIFSLSSVHKKDDLLTNRTPTNEELDAGIEYAKMLLALVPTLKIVAIGQNQQGHCSVMELNA